MKTILLFMFLAFSEQATATTYVYRQYEPGVLAPATSVASDPDWAYVKDLLHFNNTTQDTIGNSVTNTGVTFSSSIFEYGGYSGYFNGTSNLAEALSANTQFAGDFTIEAWVNPVRLGSYNILVDTRVGGSSTTGIVVFLSGSGALTAYSGTGTIAAGGNVPLNTWTFITCDRKGSTITLFVNGSPVASGLLSTNFSDGNLVIGKTNEAAANYFTGYLEELRITNGVARYTSAFPVPTAPFPNQ
ncbi:MAG: LamG domain-containing protein [Candidatus Nanopelagicales bacterium]